jgi:hypothetical protein
MATTRNCPRAPIVQRHNGSPPDPVRASPHPAAECACPSLRSVVLVMTVFALGAVLWHLSAVDKVPALAQRRHGSSEARSCRRPTFVWSTCRATTRWLVSTLKQT